MLFRRSLRRHPRRGDLTGWGDLTPVPWSPGGVFTPDDADPGDHLDYHTGTAYPQDAASQVPVLLLDPRPGEILVDTCAAPGSKTTQIGLGLGDDGLVVACDASKPRRAVLIENLARQGVGCALVTPMPMETLAERFPGAADGVLVDAPCSGHEERSDKQVARMALRQGAILAAAAALVRPGGRLVYSTCTAYEAEDEGVIQTFLEAHPAWRVAPRTLPGCGVDRRGLGGIRLSPEDQGTEPFFAIRLERSGDGLAAGFEGVAPVQDPTVPGYGWAKGNARFLGSPQAACAALPSEARGLLLGHGDQHDPWGDQGLIERGAPATTVDRATALRLWAGEAVPGLPPGALVRTVDGGPLGRLDPRGERLRMPSRLFRAGLR